MKIMCVLRLLDLESLNFYIQLFWKDNQFYFYIQESDLNKYQFLKATIEKYRQNKKRVPGTKFNFFFRGNKFDKIILLTYYFLPKKEIFKIKRHVYWGLFGALTLGLTDDIIYCFHMWKTTEVSCFYIRMAKLKKICTTEKPIEYIYFSFTRSDFNYF